jgi:hypothetical protein
MISTQAKSSRLHFGRALVYFSIAYLLVTVLATATTVTYGVINHSPQPQDLGVGMMQAPAFVATVPYHVLIMLLVWPIFAWAYFRKRWQARHINEPAVPDQEPAILDRESADRGHELPNTRSELNESLRLSIVWLAAAMIVDLICFVVIKHPYSFTPREFYIDYEPWIALIYISIFLSPLIRLGLSRLLSRQPVAA